MRLRRFRLLDLVGTSLWVSPGLALGYAFAPAVLRVLAWIEAAGAWGTLALVLAVLGVVSHRAWRRHQLHKQRSGSPSERPLTTLDGG